MRWQFHQQACLPGAMSRKVDYCCCERDEPEPLPARQWSALDESAAREGMALWRSFRRAKIVFSRLLEPVWENHEEVR